MSTCVTNNIDLQFFTLGIVICDCLGEHILAVLPQMLADPFDQVCVLGLGDT